MLDRIGEHPRVFVLDMAEVPLADSTAARVPEVLAEKLGWYGTTVDFSGARKSVRRTLLAAGVKKPLVHYTASAEDAVDEARSRRDGNDAAATAWHSRRERWRLTTLPRRLSHFATAPRRLREPPSIGV